MAQRPRRNARWAQVALLVLGAVLAFGPIPAAGASVSGTIDAGGSLRLVLSGNDSNGASLRSAMDGNFTPLLDALPLNATTLATVTSELDAAESSILFSTLFGNRDGNVEASEVTQFTTLLLQESQLLPAGTFTPTAFLSLTLDGAAPTSSQLVSLTFLNATGPVTSTAPVGVSVELDYGFSESGSSHTLSAGTNLTGANLDLALFTGAVSAGLSLPAGTSVTSAVGFESVDVHNDPYGWAGPSVSGTFAPGTDTRVAVSFGPAFPTGDVLLAVPPLAIVGIVGALLLVRHRRRRRTRDGAVPPVSP